MTLDEITRGLRERVGTNAGLNTTVKFDFGSDGVIVVDDTASPATVDNSDRPTQCTFTVSKDDFEEIAAGRLDPTMAYMSGKLRVDDIATAMKVAAILK
ncbi:MAG: SCP2 sterol-binding domain-containing protein [Sphingomonadaceae bacterium]|nr:SCP2 sterol-binding domain-containing protein [Sphingomonadaceae bacterium]